MKSSEMLIREYVSEFMDKIYYFCLKKTGNPDGAFDLAQDISLGIITSLSKGVVPDDFPAYVWRSARNRYADYAERRRKIRERYGGDVYELDIADGEKSPEEQVLRSEQLSVLRRELAFISEDYRKIVLAFYIEDRSIRDISSALGLPENTVKSKLYRARKILKEGMDMAREFGPKSFKPENISFIESGNVTPQVPWGAANTLFSKNVLIEAADNPSTVEELAIALGIAAPYMQEKVDELVNATLLKKLDGKKYVTDFPIVSAGKRAEAVDILKKSAHEAALYADEIAEDVVKTIRETGCADHSSLDDNSLKWFSVFETVTTAEGDSGMNFSREPRANGDDWEFYGFEEGDRHIDCNFVSHNTNGTDSCSISMYNMHKYNLCGNFEPHDYNDKNLVLAMKMIRSGRNYNDLSKDEKSVFDSLKSLVHADSDGRLISDILMLTGDEYGKIVKVIKEHSSYKKLVGVMHKNAENILNLLKSERNPYVRKYLPGVVNITNHIRGFVADEELAAGRLGLPKKPAESLATACAVVW